VARFGYDRPGRVVKIDSRKNIAVIAIGQMKWDVPISELLPQSVRTPEGGTNRDPRASGAKNVSGLDEFEAM
jgi:DNA mismatch repair protein MutS2